MAAEIVLPGDEIPPSLLPTAQNHKKPLTLGPGLRHIPPSTITTTVAGSLSVDSRKNAIWIERNGGRYVPTQNDVVLATVHHSSVEMYLCAITPHTPLATLPQLAFEGATKKTRPQLAPGALVYARISAASKHMEPELECVSATTGKSDGLGPLKGGMVFEISLSMARRLLMPAGKKDAGEGGPGKMVVLEELAERVRFEVAVGRNGRVWVNSEEGGVKVVLAVGKALVETDENGLGVEGQRELVAKLLKGL
ncbi:putative exosome complex exonuclease rrp40 protein [Neofusicoccum parvum UCRNP2]|uniref:Ribosomal RNA-processing protein 40 n=1 Tax=Botryosphaeria parva (strain UCR-NP2) TaxID=1287680 RepID=R1FY40_BOTPV|nr:putative exosome complex exonuclease rrp40 protein [Neofusicoccum parvum UCRNP2]